MLVNNKRKIQSILLLVYIFCLKNYTIFILNNCVFSFLALQLGNNLALLIE